MFIRRLVLVPLFSNQLTLRPPLRYLPDLGCTQLFALFQSFAGLLDHLEGQILAGVMALRIDGVIQPLLRCADRFIDAIERGVRVGGQGWVVVFCHRVYS